MRTFKVTVNGTAYDVTIEEVGTAGAFVPSAAPVSTPAPTPTPVQTAAPAPAPAPKAETKGEGKAIKSPFPGTVLKLNVKAGDSVKSGDVICVVEAMKMENDICAPADGTVTSVVSAEGKNVATDEIIMYIK